MSSSSDSVFLPLIVRDAEARAHSLHGPPSLSMSTPSSGLTAAFFALYIAGGIVGLPLVFLSIVASQKPGRHPTLLNFCATWFFSSVIYTLL